MGGIHNCEMICCLWLQELSRWAPPPPPTALQCLVGPAGGVKTQDTGVAGLPAPSLGNKETTT